MAKVNRFYNPSRGKYISQFVPEKLPTNLMIAPLAQKQKKYDEVAADIQAKLGEWEQRALPGYDTKYVKDWKGKIDSFIDESMNQDMASPEFIRKYKRFVRNIREDEGLKAVGSSVAQHDEYLKRRKDLMEGKGNEYDRAFVHDYEQRYKVYTDEKGKGYTGDISLGDPSILTGVDINQEAEKYFDQLKADGSESIASLANGLSYKNGWEGVSGNKISDQAKRTLDLFYNSRAGQQLGARYDQMMFPNMPPSVALSKMSEEQRQAYEQGKKQYVGNQFLRIGQGFKYGKSSTNKDVALRMKAGWEREDLKEATFQRTIEGPLPSEQTDGKAGDYKTQINRVDNQIRSLEQAIKSEEIVRRQGYNTMSNEKFRSLQKQLEIEKNRKSKLTQDYTDLRNRIAVVTATDLYEKYPGAKNYIERLNKNIEKVKSNLTPEQAEQLSWVWDGLVSGDINAKDLDPNTIFETFKEIGVDPRKNAELRKGISRVKKIVEDNRAYKEEYEETLNTRMKEAEQTAIKEKTTIDRQYISVITDPTIDLQRGVKLPSYSKTIENDVNTNKHAYAYYDADGNPITNPNVLSEFKIGAITTESNWQSTGERGLVGTVKVKTPTIKNGKATIEEVERTIVAVPMNNRQNINKGLALDYMNNFMVAAKRGYGNTPEAKSQLDMANKLYHEELNDTLSGMSTGDKNVMSRKVGIGNGETIVPVDVYYHLEVLPSGEYGVRITDSSDNDLIPTEGEKTYFDSREKALEFILNFESEVQI